MGYFRIRPWRVDMVNGCLNLKTQPSENFVPEAKALYSYAENQIVSVIRVLLMIILFSLTGPKFLLI